MDQGNFFRKALQRADGPSMGLWQMVPGANMSRALARVPGVDWVVIDCEHGNLDDSAMHDAVPAVAAAGASPIVRIPGMESWMIKSKINQPRAPTRPFYLQQTGALDTGAHGILVPLLRTAQEAREIVKAAKFPPQGTRGFGSPYAMERFSPMPTMTEYLRQANSSLLTIVQIETQEALDNLEEIAAVDGVDILFVGPFDLGNNIGHPIIQGVFEPQLTDALARVLEVSHKFGKKCGIYNGGTGLHFDQTLLDDLTFGCPDLAAGNLLLDHIHTSSRGSWGQQEIQDYSNSDMFTSYNMQRALSTSSPAIQECRKTDNSTIPQYPPIPISPSSTLPRRRSRYSLRHTLNGGRRIHIPVYDASEKASEPLQRWRNSPPETEPASWRKDNLIQHLRGFHQLDTLPILDDWRIPPPPISSRCGFCDQHLTSWQDRADHLAQHFRHGKTMADWKGDHDFEPLIAAQVRNALPPYLLANEALTMVPFSATDPTVPDHFAQIEERNGKTVPDPEQQLDPGFDLTPDSYTKFLTWHLGRFAQQSFASGMPLLVVRTRQLSDMGHSTTTEVSGSLGGSQVKIELMRKRRATATKIRPGTAAMSDSDMFKLPADGKPLAKRWETHFSRESNRPPCVLKQAAGYIKTPGLISLGGGLPSSEYFPISEIAMCVPTAPNFSEKQHLLDSRASGAQIARIGKYDTRDGTSDFDISIAFNYGQATGSPQMMRWVTEHVDLVYNPPYADWGVCLTTGSTAALEQTVRMLCDRFRNDSILTEDYTFATAMETFVPQGIKVFGINMDEQGLLPGHMDHILETWDEGDRGARKPHLLYTVPSGQNPTGATQSLDRRREIYKVCQKHDMFIIEDEPYYFIQMKPYTGRGTEVVGNETVDDFLTRLVPTYLSMDVDGRVLRMDSFSKVLVPGSRMGWITASKEVIHKYLCHAEVANQGPSGISQLIIWKLVDETWGHEGYLRWLIDLRTSYTTRRNALLAACEDYLPTDIVSWVPPASGMFLWLKLDHTKHPDYQCRSLEEIEVEIFKNSIDQGVLFARGSWFRAEPHEELKELFLRVTFASAAEGDMCTAVQRLSAAIKKSFRIGF
ncbi:hypothetical protein CEK26_012617 [Fusarium fujikuroi]|nr:hypothetical protein CEK27_012629 [Fusarium fujikuroi]QGI99548.1 hypothetical protein CEK26_012617 [Fusarium fujikuroi]